MKKSIIKRRKRMIPASHGGSSERDGTESGESPSPRPEAASPERGSVNEDGSINLGLRRRPDDGPMSLVPELTLRQNRNQTGLPSANLTQYHSSHAAQQPHRAPQVPDSLNNGNRLAPLTSIAAVPADRQSSLSPASFLSPPRRKRSFSETDFAQGGNPGDAGYYESSKRLSSIKSILNPAGAPDDDHDDDDGGGDPSLRPAMGPRPSPRRAANAAVPPAPRRSPFSNDGPSPAAQSGTTDPHCGPAERARAERRAELRREADKMREMLAAKERELAALGQD